MARLVLLAAALTSMGLGQFLAWHHPLSSWATMLACGLSSAAVYRWPRAWLVALPAALPALGFMPWSGWLSFEEWDLAVLAIAAGGYARLATHRREAPQRTRLSSVLLGLLVAAWLSSVLVSMLRGVADAGGFEWGWWQGYREPMNSWRLAKSALLAAWLLPLWRALQREAPDATAGALSAGFAGGLGVVGLLVLWERVAYTGLLDFSSDYRTTALFWEMHVGGAALDGYLALTVPFAVRELLRASAPWRVGLAAGVVVLGSYACITTFSRGVYAAVPVGLLTMALMHAALRQRRPAAEVQTTQGAQWLPALALVACFGLGALLMFPSSGYRGLMAGLGAFWLLLPLATTLRSLSRRERVGALAMGVPCAVVLGLAATLVPKGPYLAYALTWFVAAAALLHTRRHAALASATAGAWLAAAAFVALVLLVPVVAVHWGGSGALLPSAGMVLLLLTAALLGGGGQAPRWPTAGRWQAAVAGAMATATLAVGVSLGGVYMEGRFGTSERDLQGRLQHWSRALGLLDDTADWLLGKGLGRFPAAHALSGVDEDQVGDYRWRPRDRLLVLTAGKHGQDWGSLFRISQRIGTFEGPVTVDVRLRSEFDSAFHAEICRKHLLYDDGGCTLNVSAVKGSPGQWQQLQLRLDGKGLGRVDWFAPRLITFSMAVSRSGRSVEIAKVEVRDAQGRGLLQNGDFQGGMAHWFFSSDRHHMPWHMKSMALHLLFEQGSLGLLVGGLLWACAIWRLSAGRARDHALAPALAGALTGFAVVGLFDSLLDAPRVAFAYHLLLLAALTVPGRGRVPGGR